MGYRVQGQHCQKYKLQISPAGYTARCTSSSSVGLWQRTRRFKVGGRHKPFHGLVALLERYRPTTLQRADHMDHITGLHGQLVLRDWFKFIQDLVDAFWHLGIVALVAVKLHLVICAFDIELVLGRVCLVVLKLVGLLGLCRLVGVGKLLAMVTWILRCVGKVAYFDRKGSVLIGVSMPGCLIASSGAGTCHVCAWLRGIVGVLQGGRMATRGLSGV